MVVPQFKREDYVNMGRWVQPTLPGSFWPYWGKTNSAREASGGHTFDYMLFLDGHSLYTARDREATRRIVQETFERNDFDSVARRLDEVGKTAERAHLEVLKMKDAPLERYVSELLRTYQEVVGIWTFCILAEELETQILERGLVRSSTEMPERVQPVARPTWLEDQARDVRQLAQKFRERKPGLRAADVTAEFVRRFPDLAEHVRKHVEAFSWFGTHHWMGEPYDHAKCLREIRDILDKPQANMVLPAPAITRNTEAVWHLVAALMYWRTHCAELTSKVVFDSRPMLTAQAQQWGLDYADFIYLSHKEILTALSEKRCHLPQHFEKRKKEYGCFIDAHGELHVVTGPEFRRVLDAVVGTTTANVKELKGTVASRGAPVRGKVKVLIAPKDFVRFQNGDILVAPETTPDFVPYMKLAIAIITDRGGVTSHAAIVSRELGIPCVIGTNIATSALHDGDLVEVDAEQGW